MPNLRKLYMPSCLSHKTPPNKIHYRKKLELKGNLSRSLRARTKIRGVLLGKMNLMGSREATRHKTATIRQKISPKIISRLFSLLSLRIKNM